MQAYAYVVGPQDAAWAMLFDMAGHLGFAGLSSFRGLEQVEQQSGETPICFFLFSAVSDIYSLRQAAREIRSSASPLIRFAPMIYWDHSPSVETIVALINMGFDDIVALPQAEPRLRERMARQVGRSLVFYETPGYFGPDRRDRVASLRPQRLPTRGAGPFRRMEVVRDLVRGISILSDEFSPPPAAVSAMQSLQITA